VDKQLEGLDRRFDPPVGIITWAKNIVIKLEALTFFPFFFYSLRLDSQSIWAHNTGNHSMVDDTNDGQRANGNTTGKLWVSRKKVYYFFILVFLSLAHFLIFKLPPTSSSIVILHIHLLRSGCENGIKKR
jgi:hypothetical protein